MKPVTVQPLQADEQRALTLRVHQVLQVVQLLTVLFDLRQGMLVGFMLFLEAGVDLAEIDLAARLDAESFDVVHGDHYLQYLLLRDKAVPVIPRNR